MQPVIVGSAIAVNLLLNRDELCASTIFNQVPIQLIFQDPILVAGGGAPGGLPHTLVTTVNGLLLALGLRLPRSQGQQNRA